MAITEEVPCQHFYKDMVTPNNLFQ